MINNQKNQKPTRRRVESVFAENLKQVMKEKKLSFRETAKICRVNPAVVHAWAQGGAPQDLNAVLKLCRETKVDFQWLLTGTHGVLNIGDLTLSEVFDIEDDTGLSGIFMVEAKRLKKRKS